MGESRQELAAVTRTPIIPELCDAPSSLHRKWIRAVFHGRRHAAEPTGRVRRPGGGRKRLADLDPDLVPALLALVEPDMRGDPMSPLRWTTKSTRNLSRELTAAGHRCSADTVAGLLHAEGFSLQGNAKTIEGKQNPDRDGQFRYINEQAKAFQATGDPVVSVDTKKKEVRHDAARDE